MATVALIQDERASACARQAEEPRDERGAGGFVVGCVLRRPGGLRKALALHPPTSWRRKRACERRSQVVLLPKLVLRAFSRNSKAGVRREEIRPISNPIVTQRQPSGWCAFVPRFLAHCSLGTSTETFATMPFRAEATARVQD